MHLDVVVVAPIQAKTPAEPITREKVNEQAAKMKRAAVIRQQEAEGRERACQGAVAASSSRGNATNLNPMATCLQFSYANLSLLFARFHATVKSYLGATIARILCDWASAAERRTTTMRMMRSCMACRYYSHTY